MYIQYVVEVMTSILIYIYEILLAICKHVDTYLHKYMLG